MNEKSNTGTQPARYSDDCLCNLLEQLDWMQIMKVIVALQWQYGSGSASRTPTLKELRETALGNLRQANETPGPNTVLSGGFLAQRNDDGRLEIHFVVDWAIIEPDEEQSTAQPEDVCWAPRWN